MSNKSENLSSRPLDLNPSFQVKDVRVPEQLMRAMAAEAEAARNARAKVIAAEGEHKASRSLRLAAEVIADSPAALQVSPLVIARVPSVH